MVSGKGNVLKTEIQSFIERIQEALDKWLHITGIFFDLTKVYNILNHNILLEKLYFYGIRCSTNSWLQSYLANQRQFIEINHNYSRNDKSKQV